MRPLVLLTGAEEWAEDLAKLGLVVEIIEPPGDDIGTKWFINSMDSICRAGAVVVDPSDMTVTDIWLAGLASGLGIQVIGIGESFFASIINSNPRNVCYSDFESACTFYFSTGRAAQGKTALRPFEPEERTINE